jgi:hypothetical protein
VDPDDVLAPEIERHHRRESRREIRRKNMQPRDLQMLSGLIDQAAQIEARAHRADGTGKHIVEHQRRDGELGQRAAHGLVHHFVHATAHEHRAAFDVDGANRVGKQHDRQDEPGRCLPDGLFGNAADVVSRRCQVAQYDGGGAPKGNERQHHGGCHHHFDRCRPLSRCHGKFVSKSLFLRSS